MSVTLYLQTFALIKRIRFAKSQQIRVPDRITPFNIPFAISCTKTNVWFTTEFRSRYQSGGGWFTHRLIVLIAMDPPAILRNNNENNRPLLSAAANKRKRNTITRRINNTLTTSVTIKQIGIISTNYRVVKHWLIIIIIINWSSKSKNGTSQRFSIKCTISDFK